MGDTKTLRVQSGFGAQSNLVAVLSSKEVGGVMVLIFEREIRVKFSSGNAMDTPAKSGSTAEENIELMRRIFNDTAGKEVKVDIVRVPEGGFETMEELNRWGSAAGFEAAYLTKGSVN
jgi:hypothetical protein